MTAQSESILGNHWKSRFFTIWGGQAFSLLGSSLVQFALVWWLTNTTGSATVLATASLAALLPGVVLGPFVGALVDRWNRRLLLIASDTLTACTTLVLIYLFWRGWIVPWHIYIILFLRSIAGGFQFPAMQASTSLMVPEAHLARVAGLNQMLNGAMNIAAPPLGAFLLGLLPMYNVLIVDILTASLAILPLLVLRIPQPGKAPEAVSGSPLKVLLTDVRQGVRYLRGWTGMLLLMGMAAIVNFLLNPAFSLSPLLVTKHFGGGVVEVGWFESSFGIGVVAGGLFLSVWGGFKRRIITSMTGVIGMGIGIALVGSLPANGYLLALGAITLAGVMNPICNGSIFAIMQAKVAPEMQGRVLTLLGSVSNGMAPLSMLIAGPVSDKIGIQAWYLAGGIACVLLGVIGYFVRPIHFIEDHTDENIQPANGISTTPIEVDGSRLLAD